MGIGGAWMACSPSYFCETRTKTKPFVLNSQHSPQWKTMNYFLSHEIVKSILNVAVLETRHMNLSDGTITKGDVLFWLQVKICFLIQKTFIGHFSGSIHILETRIGYSNCSTCSLIPWLHSNLRLKPFALVFQ